MTEQNTAAGAAKPLNKTETINRLAEASGLSKQQVSTLLNELAALIGKELGQGPGEFTIPGLIKIKVTRKPATEAREGINPFTKLPMMLKAKPAKNVVKVVPLKPLKDSVDK
ncbi:MAG: HU family DNA-binding protein [Thermoguttaceae bacterium]|jgi:nucleoid DNA-binding protein